MRRLEKEDRNKGYLPFEDRFQGLRYVVRIEHVRLIQYLWRSEEKFEDGEERSGEVMLLVNVPGENHVHSLMFVLRE